MEEVEIFKFEEQKVETIFLNDEPLFNPFDVGNCLDISEGSVRTYLSKMNDNQRFDIRELPEEELFNFKLKTGNLGFWLTESGLYQLIFKSRKEKAQKFVSWVTDELLPQLRKHGSYSLCRDDQILREIISNAENLLGIRRREISIQQNSTWNMKLFQLILDCSRNGMGGVKDLYDELCYLYEAETGFNIVKIALSMGLTRREYLIEKPTVCRTLYDFACEHFHGDSRQVVLLPADQSRFQIEGGSK